MKLVFTLSLLFLLLPDAEAQKLRFSDTTNKWYTYTMRSTIKAGWTIKTSRHTSYWGKGRYNNYDYNIFQTYSGSVSQPPITVNTSYEYDWVREDTSAGFVYVLQFLPKGNGVYDTVEHVLYNYNLKVGDSFSYWNAYANYMYYVDTVDSVLINGIYHKSMHFESELVAPGDFWVVEGVGSLDNVFYLSTIVSNDIPERLVCFKNNGVFLNNQHPFNFSCADSSLSVKTYQPVDDKLIVYPQPASSHVTIELPKNNATYSIRVYNITGQEVYRDEAKNQTKIFIERTLASGVYYYKIVDSDGIRYVGQLVYD